MYFMKEKQGGPFVVIHYCQPPGTGTFNRDFTTILQLVIFRAFVPCPGPYPKSEKNVNQLIKKLWPKKVFFKKKCLMFVYF